MYRRTPTASQSQTKNSPDTGVIPSFVSLSHIIVLKCLRFSQARCISSSFTFHFPHCTLTRYLVFAQANLIPLSLKRGKSLNLRASQAGFCHMTFMWGSSVTVLSALGRYFRLYIQTKTKLSTIYLARKINISDYDDKD